MTITQYSNIFNMICQGLSSVNHYHFGTFDDINRNQDNNFNQGNSIGNLYPLALCLPPNGGFVVESAASQYQQTLNFTIVFADLMFYNNDSSNNIRSIAEVSADLYTTAINFFSTLQAVSRYGATNTRDRFAINNVVWELAPFSHNDRLLALQANFTLLGLTDCPTETPDITALPAPFVYPPTTGDYELLT